MNVDIDKQEWRDDPGGCIPFVILGLLVVVLLALAIRVALG